MLPALIGPAVSGTRPKPALCQGIQGSPQVRSRPAPQAGRISDVSRKVRAMERAEQLTDAYLAALPLSAGFVNSLHHDGGQP